MHQKNLRKPLLDPGAYFFTQSFQEIPNKKIFQFEHRRNVAITFHVIQIDSEKSLKSTVANATLG